MPLPILGEADKIFQGRRPCLTMVDGRSFLVVSLTPAKSRDATTWGVTYLEAVERGFRFHDLACDSGTGLRAGACEAELAIPLRPDLFHLLQDAYRLTRRLEGAAYSHGKDPTGARRADLEARGLLRRRGPRLKVKVSLPQAEAEENQAIATFDAWCWLLNEIRQALEPLTAGGHLRSVAESQATLEAAVELLKALNHPHITTFASDLQQEIAELLAPLEWLEQQLPPLLKDLEEDMHAFIIWAGQHRQELKEDTDIPQTLRPLMRAVGDILELFHRSSSLAESLHSWLRPYLQIHL